jgi:hypothetical protein
VDIITGIFVVLVCLILVWLLTLWFAGLIILLVAGYLVIALLTGSWLGNVKSVGKRQTNVWRCA